MPNPSSAAPPNPPVPPEPLDTGCTPDGCEGAGENIGDEGATSGGGNCSGGSEATNASGEGLGEGVNAAPRSSQSESSGGGMTVTANRGSAKDLTNGVQQTGKSLGADMNHSSTYLSRMKDNGSGLGGNSWMMNEVPHLFYSDVTVDGNPETVMATPARIVFQWDSGAGAYLAKNGAKAALTKVGSDFRLSTPHGVRMLFYGPSAVSQLRGWPKSTNAAAGQTTVATYDIDLRLESLIKSDGGSDSVGLYYTYAESGDHEGRITAVEKKETRSSSVIPLLKTIYTYYGNSEADGNLNDLKLVEQQVYDLGTSSWVSVRKSHYRYYKTSGSGGMVHGLKYELDAEGYERMVANGLSPLTATDAQVAGYARAYYEYGSDKRITRSVLRADSIDITYQRLDSSGAGRNWSRRTIATRPDGATLTTYVNDANLPLFVILEKGGDQWVDYYEYDQNDHRTLHASPAAISSFSQPAEANLDFSVTLKSSAGLIEVWEYYPQTGGGAGSAPGYVKSFSVKEGSSGTEIKQQEWTYTSHSDSGSTVYKVATSKVYQSEAGGGGNPATTSYSYTWKSGTLQVDMKMVEEPVISTSKNGDGVQYETKTVYDGMGNPQWMMDELGFITYQGFDAITGAITTLIRDVDTSQVTGEPSGWTTPSGGGLHLQTDYESDFLGRVTRELGPEHSVQLEETDTSTTTIRTTIFKVYVESAHELWTAQGYATGSTGSYSFKTVGAVLIERTNVAQQLVDRIEATRLSNNGAPSPSETFSQGRWVKWSHFIYDNADLLIERRSYYLIPSSGDGTSGSNFNALHLGYDSMDRQNKEVSPGGTITRKVFDVRNLVTELWVGTDDTGASDTSPGNGGAGGNNMKQVAEYEYDGGDDEGNGDLPKETVFVDSNSANNRETSHAYDFRGRLTRTSRTDGNADFITEWTLDNLGRITDVDEYHTSVATGNLTGKRKFFFDDRGNSYKREVYGVDASNGTIGDKMASESWRDGRLQVVKQTRFGSEVFAKIVFDGIGRRTKSYLAVNSGTSSNNNSVSADTVIEQEETDFDAAGNIILLTSYQRFDDATGTGALNGPNGSQPKSRRSYLADWPDGIGRQRFVAIYGTNGGATLTRPSVAPTGSDTILVTTTKYKDDGDANRIIDPNGIETRWDNDALDRRIKLVENYDASSSDPDANRTSEYAYHADGEIETMTLVNSVTGNQVTTWVYGTTLSDSEVSRSDLLRAKIYPESDDVASPLGNGGDGIYERIEYRYNRLGQAIEMKDPNETVHAYDYDELGRLLHDRVTGFGTDIDQAVKRISRAYDSKVLMPSRMTSWDHATVGSGNVINEVEFTYDDFVQLKDDKQSHSGAVGGSTPTVSYGYADASSGNTVRRNTMTYPDGRQVDFGYGSAGSIDDLLSRVASVKINGESTDSVVYTCMGAGRYIEIDYPEPGVQLTYRKQGSEPVGDAGDPYTGYDRFGRTVDMRWLKTSNGSELDRIRYGYDRASNRKWRENLVATSGEDSFYEYDGLYQVKDAARGDLNIAETAIGGIPKHEETFTYDPTGNWDDYLLEEDGSSVLSQSRIHNKDNQLTQIDGSSTGVSHDRAGNATLMPPDASGDWAESYTLVWDAWNRLVEVKDDTSATVGAYAYDGIYRRITKTLSGTTIHYYYNDRWKCVEEREGSSTDAKTQYLWGERSGHRDELALRDKDTTGNGALDERLFCLMDYFNPTAVINTSAVVQERYGFSAFGVRRVLAADFSGRSSSNFGWLFGFHGQFLDVDSGYSNYGYRYYAAELGRWLSRDPIGEVSGANLYDFVGNSPVNRTDFFGLCTKAVVSERFEVTEGLYSNPIDPEVKEKILMGMTAMEKVTRLTKAAQAKGAAATVDAAREALETGMAEMEKAAKAATDALTISGITVININFYLEYRCCECGEPVTSGETRTASAGNLVNSLSDALKEQQKLREKAHAAADKECS